MHHRRKHPSSKPCCKRQPSTIKPGRFAEAEKACRRILRDRPSHPETNFILGIVLKSQNKVPEAEAAFRRAVLGAPDVAAGHNNLGSILFSQGKLEEAEASY